MSVREGGDGSVVMEKTALVLVAGLGRGPFDALAPVLDRQKLELVKVATPGNSVALATSEPFDLVIIGAGTDRGRLEKVVDSIRHGMSASRNASILVLARPGQAEAARNLVGRGVNRVMLLEDPPEIVGQQVADLLDIAPRANLRFSTRLQTAVADGSIEVLGDVINLSATGMLVETKTSFETGEQVVVTINLAGQLGLVSAKAEVVRQAHRDRGGVDGIGLRFLSFARDGEEKIQAVLKEAFADSLIN